MTPVTLIKMIAQAVETYLHDAGCVAISVEIKDNYLNVTFLNTLSESRNPSYSLDRTTLAELCDELYAMR